jgi:hypothetical protein
MLVFKTRILVMNPRLTPYKKIIKNNNSKLKKGLKISKH